MKKEQKEVVKRKFNFKKLIIVLLLLYLFGYFVYQFLLTPIKSIYISNNKYLSDQEIIDEAGIKDYPSFFLTFNYRITNKLIKNKMIKSVTVTKKSFGKLYISVTENKPLFYDVISKKTILADGEKISFNSYIVPMLINTVKDEVYEKLPSKISKINEEILSMISEMKYTPNDIDKERFLFVMNDGNYVYITLTKITSINEYIKIAETLNEKKGILYLDSGNYFEIFN